MSTKDLNIDPMILACQEGNLKIVQELHAAEKEWVQCSCPLFSALMYENLNIVQYLLDNGTDITYIDDEGCTALHYAVLSENADCVKLILENIPKRLINYVTTDGEQTTALDDYYNSPFRDERMLSLLKQYGAKCNENYEL